MADTAWSRLVASAIASSLVLVPVAARAAPSDIVVTGVRSGLSGWRQAETSHVLVLSDGSEDELVKLTRNLERLHFLLSGLMGRGAADDDTVKIRITLIGDVLEFSNMHLVNKRWQQGPYNDLFQISRFYDPRADGVVMASTRADQRVVVEHTTITPQSVAGVLNSVAASGTDPQLRAELSAAVGGFEVTAGMRSSQDHPVTYGEKAIEMSAESLLYAGYAQHFLQTYYPAAYPRWYLDGFGQVFSTMVVKSDTVLEFGRAPNGAQTVMHEFGPYPIKDVLDDAYLSEKPHKTGWTPIHAWALTHFLFFSDTRRPQLRQYLAARAQGEDGATAAQVFGDQKVLAHELVGYFAHRKPYLQISYDGAKIEQPIVRRLRQSEAAFVKGRLEVGARVDIPYAPTADMQPDQAKAIAKARVEALRLRDSWLADLRRDAARWSGEPGAQLLLAEAECRSGHPDLCLVAAGNAARLAPEDPRAMVWKALALIQQATAAAPEAREPLVATARDLIVKANQIDHEAIGPMMAYYESFAAVGQMPSTAAIDGLQKAMEEVPAAPQTRLTLAAALAKRGQYDVARPVIMPVAAGAYDSPEKPAAKALLARLDSSTGTQEQSHVAPGQSEPGKVSGARPAPSADGVAATQP
ncbi:MAG TPA: hypothetical protein VK533_10735 [Sphingomonas sp.]|uniref:hypothetical protein n=1 Tax=Sphingomonas sp. TaxID=28214 RepID=UPI002B72EEBD|nr:hypothetical protein [Sphingomonas sp.]HMI20011.1 hypothetical protein [Sphingomonas sp.]